jgi:hypothetical protein
MPLDTFTVGLTIDDFPEFCGPEDLSDAIISLRKSERDIKWLAPISDDGIRRLFKLAYYTSLAPEEGRYPRFRLICVDTAPDNIFFAASFNTPINNVESLRRLAPAASETGGALLVTECNGTLLCNSTLMKMRKLQRHSVRVQRRL